MPREAKFVILPPDESEDTLWSIHDGLPQLENGTLLEIPREPYTFVVDMLNVLNHDGSLQTQLYKVRVILAHGTYHNTSHQFNFLNGRPIKPIVMKWNETHEDAPIAFVVACSGTQQPINTTEVNDDSVFLGSFTPWERVAYSLSSDIGITLYVENEKTYMSVQPRDQDFGFINLEQLKSKYGLESQIILSD